MEAGYHLGHSGVRCLSACGAQKQTWGPSTEDRRAYEKLFKFKLLTYSNLCKTCHRIIQQFGLEGTFKGHESNSLQWIGTISTRSGYSCPCPSSQILSLFDFLLSRLPSPYPFFFHDYRFPASLLADVILCGNGIGSGGSSPFQAASLWFWGSAKLCSAL